MKPTYEYTPVSEAQKALLEMFNEAFAELDARLLEQVPAGRYLALARTALEESAMWASKSISKQ